MKRTLVFGASLNPGRYSNLAIHRLLGHGQEVVAFGLRPGDVGGITIQTDLQQIRGVHTVTLYMNPKRQQQYYQDILDLEPERVIFNPGTENPEFYDLLKSEGIAVEVACTLVMLSMGQY